jgi:hypothetical protein
MLLRNLHAIQMLHVVHCGPIKKFSVGMRWVKLGFMGIKNIFTKLQVDYSR